MKKTIALPLITVFLLFVTPLYGQIEIGLTESNIGIGSAAPNSNYKLSLEYALSSTSKRGIYVKNTSTANVHASGLEVNNAANAGYGYGGRFFGGWTGIRSDARAVGSGTATRYGLWAYASNGSSNYGIVAQANDNGSGGSYGIWGAVLNNTNNMSWAGYFAGNVYATGTVTELSDGRAKENKRSLDERGILEEVLKLNPVSYTYKQAEGYDRLALPSGDHYGFLSEEVEQVFPNLVNEVVHNEPFDPTDPSNEGKSAPEEIRLKALNYTGIIPLLVQAIQEQQAEIDELKALISNR